MALLTVLVLTPVVRRFAIEWQFVDAVGSVRKLHASPTPRLGGLAMVAAFYLAVLVVFALSPDLRARAATSSLRSLVFLLGGVMAAGLGLVDDLRGLRARHKLAVEVALGCLLCWSGFRVDGILLPAGNVLDLGAFGIPLTVLWIVGVMNAINLIDGLDGLAAGLSAIALAATIAFAVGLGKPVLGLYTAALAGAAIGFLRYNSHPASIFMGDTGSLFLGYNLAVVSVLAARLPQTSIVEPYLPLMILGVPIGDTLLAITRRALWGRPLFSADREHLHHRLLARGLSQPRAALVLYVVGAAFALNALAIRFGGFAIGIPVTVLLFGAGLWSVWRLKMLDLRVDVLLDTRRRNQELRGALETAALLLKRARDLDEVAAAVDCLAPALGASYVRLRAGDLAAKDGSGVARPGVRQMRFLVRYGSRRVGGLEVGWNDDRVEIEQALAIEQLCDDLGRALVATSRLGRSAGGKSARANAGT